MKVHLRVTEGPDLGRTFTFETRDRFIIGRAATAHFQIEEDPFFSRHHVMLEVNPPRVLLQDLRSTNGTFVNDGRTEVSDLRHGDTIWGGKTRITLTLEDDAPPSAPGVDVASLLGGLPLDPYKKVAVRCGRCGHRAPNEVDRSRAEGMAYLCDDCQVALIDNPVLPPGYQLVRKLGHGGMGAVYLIEHAHVGQRAMKMILPKAAMAKKMRDLFAREVSEQARLDHPRVVRVIDFQEVVPAIFCMIMEFVEGQSADKLVDASPDGIDPRLATAIVVQALEGLAEVHRARLVHRDIKESNLLVTRDRAGALAVKLADFGLAKSYEQSGASGFTRTGEVSGTMPYMSPEQILDFKNARPPADIYSMGATLYRLLTGQFAYDFRRAMDPLVTILEEEIVPARVRKPSVAVELDAVITRAMQKDPAARFADADEMRLAVMAATP